MRAARLQNWKLDWYQFKDAKKWKQCSKLAVLRDVWELINPKGLLWMAHPWAFRHAHADKHKAFLSLSFPLCTMRERKVINCFPFPFQPTLLMLATIITLYKLISFKLHNCYSYITFEASRVKALAVSHIAKKWQSQHQAKASRPPSLPVTHGGTALGWENWTRHDASFRKFALQRGEKPCFWEAAQEEKEDMRESRRGKGRSLSEAFALKIWKTPNLAFVEQCPKR